jgi:hypothetical protein
MIRGLKVEVDWACFHQAAFMDTDPYRYVASGEISFQLLSSK